MQRTTISSESLMEKSSSPLSSKAFGEGADPDLIVAYQAHQDALRFLSGELAQANGVVLLLGPEGSGKTTVINEQVDWSRRDTSVALLDGAQMTPRELTAGLLLQFDIQSTSQEEQQLLQLLSAYLTEQAKMGRAPILVLDNADRATPSALRLLNWFAALDVRGQYALRIILTGRTRLATFLKHGALRNLARRNPTVFSLNPMTSQETTLYLRTRFIAAGGSRSEEVFSIEACEQLRALSCGWPGALNRLAHETLESRSDSRLEKRIPRITVSRDGVDTAEYELSERQYVIGRTDLADIVIDDTYASKMHAMLQVYSNAVVLIDLNSTNGTTVNSVVVQKTILRDNDIISLGRYRIKIEDVPAISQETDDLITASDTLVMKQLLDIRRSRARRTIKLLKYS
jgi:type II secretory pathway predicted ATPase ExeA